MRSVTQIKVMVPSRRSCKTRSALWQRCVGFQNSLGDRGWFFYSLCVLFSVCSRLGTASCDEQCDGVTSSFGRRAAASCAPQAVRQSIFANSCQIFRKPCLTSCPRCLGPKLSVFPKAIATIMDLTLSRSFRLADKS